MTGGCMYFALCCYHTEVEPPDPELGDGLCEEYDDEFEP